MEQKKKNSWLLFDDLNKNRLTNESISYINTVIESIYNYEVDEQTNHEFRNSLYIAQLYKYFISGEMSSKIVEEIINGMDFKLVKKFDVSKDIYRDILVKYAKGA